VDFLVMNISLVVSRTLDWQDISDEDKGSKPYCCPVLLPALRPTPHLQRVVPASPANSLFGAGLVDGTAGWVAWLDLRKPPHCDRQPARWCKSITSLSVDRTPIRCTIVSAHGRCPKRKGWCTTQTDPAAGHNGVLDLGCLTPTALV
jgi:hypothetical protein